MSKPEPRFQLGDRVYIQMYGLQLYSDDARSAPKKLLIRGVVRTCDFDRGFAEHSRPVPGTDAIKYWTSYSEKLFPEDELFATVEEFEERRGDEIRALAAEQEAKAQAKRVEEYRAAKALVARFESALFEAHAAQVSAQAGA